jgi:hypothetical protein
MPGGPGGRSGAQALDSSACPVLPGIKFRKLFLYKSHFCHKLVGQKDNLVVLGESFKPFLPDGPGTAAGLGSGKMWPGAYNDNFVAVGVGWLADKPGVGRGGGGPDPGQTLAARENSRGFLARILHGLKLFLF